MTAEQKSAAAMSRCEARRLEPDEPKVVCANCGERVRAGMEYKHEPVCSQGCFNDLLERDR